MKLDEIRIYPIMGVSLGISWEDGNRIFEDDANYIIIECLIFGIVFRLVSS